MPTRPSLARRLATVGCFGAAWLGSLPAQTPAWRLLGNPIFAPETGAMVYDDLHDRTVFFGGGTGYVPWAMLLTLDGDTWTSASSSSPWPTARFLPALAFDSRRGEVVMQGGSALGPVWFTDTWRWNGTAWRQVLSAHAPAAMYGHAMTYDERRDRLVLFGASTWEWDGGDWLPLTPAAAPASRTFPALAFDAGRGRTVLFGGIQGSANLTDTWEWDGAAWLQVATTGLQPAAVMPTMAYDRERARTLLIGLQVGGGLLAYEYDGAAWSAVAAPAVNASGYLAYDRQAGRSVYFATQRALGGGQTWVLETPGLAVAQPFGVACGTPALEARVDPAARPVSGSGLGVDVLEAPTGLAFMCLGWSNRQVLGITLPTTMDAFGMPDCWLLQSDDAITLPCTTTGPTSARFSMAIPADASFQGLRFYLQPWAPAPGAFPPVNAVVGNGVAVTIGAH
jgi:hypothetical protein